MMIAWRLPGCRIPDDDVRLARWARVDRRTWVKMKPTIMAFWEQGEDGYWTQPGLLEQWEFVSKRATVRRENGKHGGRPKSLKSNDLGNLGGNLERTEQKAHTLTLKAPPNGGAAGARALEGIEDGRENPPGSPVAGDQASAATSAPVVAERQPAASVEQSTVIPDPKSVPDFIQRTLEANPDMGANAASSLALLSPQELNLWVAKGYDLALDIEPAITSWLARPGRRAPKTWGYFRGIVEEYREKRLAMPQAAAAPAKRHSRQNPDGTRRPDFDGNMTLNLRSPVDNSFRELLPDDPTMRRALGFAVEGFLKGRPWNEEDLGAPPGHPACLVPADILAKFMPHLAAGESAGSTARLWRRR